MVNVFPNLPPTNVFFFIFYFFIFYFFYFFYFFFLTALLAFYSDTIVVNEKCDALSIISDSRLALEVIGPVIVKLERFLTNYEAPPCKKGN